MEFICKLYTSYKDAIYALLFLQKFHYHSNLQQKPGECNGLESNLSNVVMGSVVYFAIFNLITTKAVKG